MTHLEQTIIEKIHSFPPEKQKKLLDYAKTLENEGTAEETEHQTIWEMVKDIIEEVPKEAWDESLTVSNRKQSWTNKRLDWHKLDFRKVCKN